MSDAQPRRSGRFWLRFHLRDVFLGITLAAAFLSVWLWPRWDFRERVYLGIGELILWAWFMRQRANSWVGCAWVSLMLGGATAVAGTVDYCWLVSPPKRNVNEIVVLYFTLCTLLVTGSGCLAGLVTIYAGQRILWLRRWMWIHLPPRRKLAPILVVVFAECASLGVFFNLVWPTWPMNWKLRLIAVMALSIAAAICGLVGTVAIKGILVAGRWLRAQWNGTWTTRRARWFVIAAAAAAVTLLAPMIRPSESAWRVRRWNIDGFAHHSALSPNGALVALGLPTVSGEEVRVHKWDSMSLLSSHGKRGTSGHFQFFGDENYLLYLEVGGKQKLVVTDPRSGTRLQEIPLDTGFIRKVWFTTDGKQCWVDATVYSQYGPLEFRIWSTEAWENGPNILTLDASDQAWPHDLSPDTGCALLISRNGAFSSLQMWHVSSGSMKGEYTLPIDYVKCAEISSDGQWVAANQFLWNVGSGRRFELPVSTVRDLKFTPDSKKLFVWDEHEFFIPATVCDYINELPFFHHLQFLGGVRLRVFDTASQALLSTSHWSNANFIQHSISRNGSRLLYNGFSPYRQEWRLELWDAIEKK